MSSYRDIMDDLETQVEKTEEDFDSVKDQVEPAKREKAEELMDEIEDQIEFLEKQLEKIE